MKVWEYDSMRVWFWVLLFVSMTVCESGSFRMQESESLTVREFENMIVAAMYMCTCMYILC